MIKRNVEIKVRLSRKEAEALNKRVKKSGISREAYIRHLIEGSVPREAPPPDYYAKRKTKWFPTGLPVKGNKKKTEKMLMELRKEFIPDEKPLEQGILFADFMLQWLEIVKPTIAVTTYSSYCNMVKGVIAPYFKAKGISLGDLKATDIQAFYMEQLKRVSPNSVIHYHANIHKALKYAIKLI